MAELNPDGSEMTEDPESMETSFFQGKRPWSKIKDQVLETYMTPYMRKVANLGKPIILVDSFAGPGKFIDGTTGSPLIICHAAEQNVRDNYQGIFVNSDKEHHDQLSHVLSSLIDQKKVVCIHGSSSSLLARIDGLIGGHTVFLYLDPFGLKGCEFSTIEPFLRRDKAYSTEVVINLSIPTIHRLATRKAVAEGRADTPQIRSLHKRLTRVLGGEYWKEIFWDESKDSDAKADEVMKRYREKISALDMSFTGSCPVREKEGSRIKYYITFGSRHQDAMILMNDAMCRAYNQQMHAAATEGTLFAGTSWKDARDVRVLEGVVLKVVGETPGRRRSDLWAEIVGRHFMRFMATEFREAVKNLVEGNQLRFEDIRGTKRLNDDICLYLNRDGAG